tara:strand:+ start:356 stop:535 length:180 start_codon:yes stop_codon:yes gene_type:complete
MNNILLFIFIVAVVLVIFTDCDDVKQEVFGGRDFFQYDPFIRDYSSVESKNNFPSSRTF